MRIVRYAARAIKIFFGQLFFIRTYWNLSKRTEKAIAWLVSNTQKDEGIKVTSKISKTYPEVTGYLIPTLINWGERELACQYASYLAEIQNPDGGFPTPQSSNSAFFDTGQVVRGLMSISNIGEDYIPQIIKAINFMASSINDRGEIILSEEADWAGEVPRAISLYAIAPCVLWLRNNDAESALIQKFSLAIEKIVSDPGILLLQSVNHFHAYIMDALIDLGYEDLARKGMQQLRPLNNKGAIAGNSTETWICTTGQFQYSIILGKLGQHQDAVNSFLAAAKKQNRSGGWYGSVGRLAALGNCIYPMAPRKKMYFPNDEIPWANKYYLDALSQIMRLNFNHVATTFKSKIDVDDNRYVETFNFIRSLPAGSTVLDAGCGKGRFLLPLSDAYPEINFVAMDISAKVMEEIPNRYMKIVSPITNIDAIDSSFDAIIIVEALEHAAYVRGALRELCRVVRPGGSILIVDKRKRFTTTILEPWETWFSRKTLKNESETLNLRYVEYKLLGQIEKTQNLFFSLKVTKKL